MIHKVVLMAAKAGFYGGKGKVPVDIFKVSAKRKVVLLMLYDLVLCPKQSALW